MTNESYERRAPRKTDTEGGLAEVLTSALGGSGGIEAQESRGQQSFVSSTTLPTDMQGDARAVLEAAGVKFGELVDGDLMFQYVELPEGWEKVATDHSMWSNLLDNDGRVRATIFYKAAFYDRSASLNVSTRFSVKFDYEQFKNEEIAVSLVKDGNETIFETDPIAREGRESWEVSDGTNLSARLWLKSKHPDYQNPAAYWED